MLNIAIYLSFTLFLKIMESVDSLADMIFMLGRCIKLCAKQILLNTLLKNLVGSQHDIMPFFILERD